MASSTAPAASIAFHPAGFLHVTWLAGPISSAATRAVLEHVLLELRTWGCHKVLTDQRLTDPPADEDATWYMLDWLPRAAQQGYRYGAILNSTHLFARLAVHSISQQAMQHSGLVYQHFDREDLAIEWLLAQE